MKVFQKLQEMDLLNKVLMEYVEEDTKLTKVIIGNI